MNAVQLAEVGRLVLETIAEVEGVSIERIQAGYQAGDESVVRMFKSYVAATLPTIQATLAKMQAA